MKPPKPLKQTHTSNAKTCSGDFYGTGFKNPVGKTIDSYLTPVLKGKDIGKAPRSLA